MVQGLLRSESLVRRHVEQAMHKIAGCIRDVAPALAFHRVRALKNSFVILEGQIAAQQYEHHDANAPEVTLVSALLLQHLRCRISKGAAAPTHSPTLLELFTEAEV